VRPVALVLLHTEDASSPATHSALPLERVRRHRFLSRVQEYRLLPGVRAGLIVWAATCGVLVGFGWRHGTATAPFVHFGSILLARFGVHRLAPGPAIAAGLLGHAAWMSLWGAGFWAVSSRLRAGLALPVALVLAAVAYLLSASWLPAAMGAIRYAPIVPAQEAVLAVVMATGLVISRTFVRTR